MHPAYGDIQNILFIIPVILTIKKRGPSLALFPQNHNPKIKN
jgi:hypothetical protein